MCVYVLRFLRVCVGLCFCVRVSVCLSETESTLNKILEAALVTNDRVTGKAGRASVGETTFLT